MQQLRDAIGEDIFIGPILRAEPWIRPFVEGVPKATVDTGVTAAEMKDAWDEPEQA